MMPPSIIDFAAAIALLLCGLAALRSCLLGLLERRLLPILLRVPVRRSRTLAAGLLAGAGASLGALLPRLLGPAMVRNSMLSSTALEALLAAGAGAGLVAVALAANPTGASQFALVAGAAMILSRKEAFADSGKALVGAGLALMALRLLSGLTGSAATHDLFALLAAALERDILLAATLGVMASLLLRSGMAAVLILGVLCAERQLSSGAALPMMLGANLGSAVMTWTAARDREADVQRVATAALLVRMLAVAGSLLLLDGFVGSVAGSGDPALALAAAHLLFNLVTALLAAGLAQPLLTIVGNWLPAGGAAVEDRLEPVTELLTQPSVALGSATREVVRLANLVEMMLRGMLQVFLSGDVKQARSVGNMEHAVDTCFRGIKHYLARVRRLPLSDDELRRWKELMIFAISLEQAADAVERVLEDFARRAPAFSAAFPAPDVIEVCRLHAMLMHNERLAVMLLLRRDRGVARELAAAQTAFLERLRRGQTAHLHRLSAQDPATAAVSEFYLDLLGNLGRLNALLCALTDAFLAVREESSDLPFAASGATGPWCGTLFPLQEGK